MEQVHVCPHCNRALDQEGECLIKKKKAAKAEAEKLFREMRNKNWVLKNTKWLLVAFAGMYAVLGLYFFTAPIINGETAGRGIIAFIPLFALIVFLKHVNDKKVFKAFEQTHGMNACYLLYEK